MHQIVFHTSWTKGASREDSLLVAAIWHASTQISILAYFWRREPHDAVANWSMSGPYENSNAVAIVLEIDLVAVANVT